MITFLLTDTIFGFGYLGEDMFPFLINEHRGKILLEVTAKQNYVNTGLFCSIPGDSLPGY